MAFSENLRRLREKRGLSQEQLADCLNIPRSTITHYENQTNERLPRMDRLKLIADFFNVSIDQIVSKTNDAGLKDNIINQPPDPNIIPILGIIRAGLPILADENIEGYMEIPETLRADYILRVQGDSMIGAGILDGDLVICKEAQTAFSGQIVVALHDESTGFSDATLKYYFDVNGNGPVLRPANPQYQEIEFKDGHRVAGVMVALVRSDAPGYQVYKNYLAANDSDEWTEVIESATGKGMSPKQLLNLIEMQWQMAQKLSKDK